MAIGDEIYLKGDSGRDGSARLREVADANGDGINDLQLESRADGRWNPGALAVPAPYGVVAGGVADCAGALAGLGSGSVPFPRGVYRLSTLVGFAGQTWLMQPGAYPALDLGAPVPLPHLLPRIVWQALPPMAPGMAGCVGDSRGLRGVTVADVGVPPAVGVENIFGWATVGSYGAVHFDPAYAFAVGGSRPSDIDPQITNLLAVGRPTWCYVGPTGANDLNTVTAGQQVSVLLNVWFRLCAAGIRPIHVTDMVRFAAGMTGSLAGIGTRDTATTNILRRLAPAFGVLFYDTSRLLADPASSTGDPRTTWMNADGVHQRERGAVGIGMPLGQDLRSLIAPYFYGYDQSYTLQDQYDATYSPFGNLYPNPCFRGTSGGADTGVTGSVPNNVYVNFPVVSGLSAVASIPAGADGRNVFQLVITRGSANATADVSLTGITNGNIVALRGKTIRASIDVETTNLDEVYLYCSYGGVSYSVQMGGGATAYMGDVKGRMYLPDHKVPAAATAVGLAVSWQARSAGAATQTLKLSLPTFRAVD